MDFASWLLFLLLAFLASPSSASRYIIQVEEPIETLTESSLKRWHESFLPPAAEESGADRRLLHSYSDVFSVRAATVILPNGVEIPGESIIEHPSEFTKTSLPLYYSTENPTCENRGPPAGRRYRGSVWVCEAGDRKLEIVAGHVKSLGGKALIFIASKPIIDTAQIRKLDFPGVIIANKYGSDIKSYLNLTPSNPYVWLVFNRT